MCITNNTVGAERIEVNLTVRNPLSVKVDPVRQTVRYILTLLVLINSLYPSEKYYSLKAHSH